MRTLRYTVLALLFIIASVAIIGIFLPAKVHLERSTVINRSADKIFPVINALKNFNNWSPWYEYDTHAVYILSGANQGVGSKLAWEGNDKVGKGSNEIIASKTNEYVKTKFYFGKNEKPAHSTLSLKPLGLDQGTQVTWAFETDFGYNVFYRYFGLVLEDMIAPDYERGLEKLKSHVQSLPLYDYSNVSIVETQGELIYTHANRSGLNPKQITQAITESYGKIISHILNNNQQQKGTPKLINVLYDSNEYQFIAAIVVDDNSVKDPSGEIISSTTYQGKAIQLIHKGSYQNFKSSYTVLSAYMQQNNLIQKGRSWEDYVTDPGQVSKDELITHIYQPIE